MNHLHFEMKEEVEYDDDETYRIIDSISLIIIEVLHIAEDIC